MHFPGGLRLPRENHLIQSQCFAHRPRLPRATAWHGQRFGVGDFGGVAPTRLF